MWWVSISLDVSTVVKGEVGLRIIHVLNNPPANPSFSSRSQARSVARSLLYGQLVLGGGGGHAEGRYGLLGGIIIGFASLPTAWHKESFLHQSTHAVSCILRSATPYHAIPCLHAHAHAVLLLHPRWMPPANIGQATPSKCYEVTNSFAYIHTYIHMCVACSVRMYLHTYIVIITGPKIYIGRACIVQLIQIVLPASS